MTILTLLITVILMSVGWLWMDMGRASIVALKAQTMSDVSVFSSLSLRAETLETIANRWGEFGSLFGSVNPDGTVMLPSSHWDTVEKLAGELKRALPGYQGRFTAVIKVVAEANGFERENIEVRDTGATRLGLEAESLMIQDEFGNLKTIQGGWLRRLWGPEESNPRTRHDITAQVEVRSKELWSFGRSTEGDVVWDVAKDDPLVMTTGNGGFPRSWSEALSDGRLNPHRFPFFKAQLKGGEI